MSIAKLINSYESQLDSIEREIESYSLSISEPDIISDPNVKLAKSNTEDENDLSQLSLTQLNAKVQDLDSSLADLDKLWYINGYVQEIKSMIDNEADQLEKFELELIVNDLKKLSVSVANLDDSVIIKNSIVKELESLLGNFGELLTKEFNLFLPNEFRFCKKLENGLEFFELTKIIESFDETFNNSALLKTLYQDMKIKWDNIINKVIGDISYLELKSSDDNTFEMVLKPYKEFSEEYFDSITSFIQFINLFESYYINSFYSSKISIDLTNKLAENINLIIHNDNKDQSEIYIEKVFALINLAKNTHWNILSGLDTSSKFQDKLNELYLDWVADKYINKLRVFINGNFRKLIDDLQEKSKSKPKEKQETKPSQDDWNEEWPDEDEDGWDNEIKLDDEDDWEWNKDGNEEAKTEKDADLIKISKVPDEFIKIYREYSEITNNYNNQYLVTAIKSLCLGKYPGMNKSFLLLNDFEYLSAELDIPDFVGFASSMWNQTLFQITNKLTLILSSIELSHDSYEQNLEDYELDDDNLNKLSMIYQLLTELVESDLAYTNFVMFKMLIVNSINLINYTLINSIISVDDISEFQSLKFTKLFDQLNNITIPFLYNIKATKEDLASYSKQSNLLYLLNNHLKDIMERFYQGELFDFETDELINVLKSVFIKSELRDGYIEEIIETRSL